MYIQSFVHHSLATTSNEETFSRNSLEFLGSLVELYGTTHIVLPDFKGLSKVQVDFIRIISDIMLANAIPIIYLLLHT